MEEELQRIVDKLKNYQNELRQIYGDAPSYQSPKQYGDQKFERWKERLVDYVQGTISQEEARKCSKLVFPLSVITRDPFQNFDSQVTAYFSYLQTLTEDITSYPETWLSKISMQSKPVPSQLASIRPEPLEIITLLCKKFHSVGSQLRKRHATRKTLDVKDEYDVQDLLYAFLRIFFYDIRTEEWTPSYAGGSSKMDFLLKDEKIVVETKMTRSHPKTGISC